MGAASRWKEETKVLVKDTALKAIKEAGKGGICLPSLVARVNETKRLKHIRLSTSRLAQMLRSDDQVTVHRKNFQEGGHQNHVTIYNWVVK